MADGYKYVRDDTMFFDEEKYPPEVRLGEDGFYRWRYTMDSYHDRKMYRLMLKIWALLSLMGAGGGFFYAQAPADLVRKNPHNYPALMLGSQLIHAVLGYAAFFLLGLIVTGLVRLIEGGPSTYWYRMNGEFIQLQPSGKGSGITAFENVQKAELYPEVNEIRLFTRWGKCPVLVRKEDYETIKEHIIPRCNNL